MKSKLKKKKTIFNGKIFNVESHEAIFPNGKKLKRDLVIHNGASVIIPEVRKGTLCMIKQYRYAINEI